MNVIELEHPLVKHKLSILRNKETGTKKFRELVSELSTMLCYEALKDAVLEDIEVETEVVYADEDATVSELQRITLAPKQPEVYAEENNRNDAYYEDQQDPQSEEEQAQQPAYQATEEREENALYLTGMMAKSEEQFTRVKMCIIQEDESLDTIANRYDVSTSQLIRTNRLEADHVEAGQILYIPVQS